MKTKKKVCFIANQQHTSEKITHELNEFLGNYLEIKSWCLQNRHIPHECKNCDVYVASSYTALEKAKPYLPKDKKILVADRALNTNNLDKILELNSNTNVLVVANSQETAATAINLLKQVGVTYLSFYPYYPGTKSKVPSDISIAVTTGLAHLTPKNISKIIDLDVKGLDLSTYVELIIETNLPKELINQISQKYIKEIFNLSIRQHHIAQINSNLKRKLEVMINTVDEAILAINENREIILINSAAEKLLFINNYLAMGKQLKEVFPQINIDKVIEDRLSIENKIMELNNRFYVLNANPIKNSDDSIEGAILTIKPVDKVQELETKVRRELKSQGNIAKYTFSDIIGNSTQIRKINDLAKHFAGTDLTILIEGESGTGKEIYAQAIHNLSKRRHGPFVAVNFAALPENLAESELFGYEEGAFTGAKKGGKKGLFEEAHNGTIFLDEIGDASLEVQKKLLRVLEEREVRRVGGRNVTPIDVRVITATNQNLEKLVDEGLFRNDLFYRLCTLPLSVPPLRERDDDLLILIDYFSKKLYKKKLELDNPVKDFLFTYSWPGNIRELENVVNYLCSIVPSSERATLNHLPLYLTRNSARLASEIKPFNQNKFDLIIQKFQSQDLLICVSILLKEIQECTMLNKGVGRRSLLKLLESYGFKNFPDHRLRSLINNLVRFQLIESGKTKQGTKITSLGVSFLNHLHKSKYTQAAEKAVK